MPDLTHEFDWLQQIILTMTGGNRKDALAPKWSAHYADKKRGPAFEGTITSLIPFLRNAAHSVATIRHIMDKIIE